MNAFQKHQREERRAMELIAGLVTLAGAALVGMAAVLIADHWTGLDVFISALDALRGL